MISTQLLQERTVFQVVVHQFGCPGDCDHGATPLKVQGEGSKRLEPRVVDVRDPARIEDHGLDRLGAPLDELADPYAQVVSVAVPQRRVDEVDENARHLLGRLPDVERDQWSVPGSRPRTASWGRADRLVRSASERIRAASTPCSMPTSATTNRVIVASANSRRSKRKMARSSRHETAWPQ